MTEQLEQTQTKRSSHPVAVRWRQGAVLFRLGLGIFLLLSNLFGLWGCSASSSSLSWSSASTQLEADQLFHLVLSNVSDQTSVAEIEAIGEAMRVARLGSANETKLYVVQMTHPQTCGQLGCLHLIAAVPPGHPETLDTIWSRYLHPDTAQHHAIRVVAPPNGAVDTPDYPCIGLTQLGSVSRHLTIECYIKGQYQVIERQQSELE
jgi:hypothetical protein